MRLCIVAVGQRMPEWAEQAYADYARRFPPELKLELRAVRTQVRSGQTRQALLAAEATRIEAALPKAAWRVVLDEHGRALRTEGLAQRLAAWMQGGRDVAFLIGGPDGLAPALIGAADETLRLSDLTLPHAMVRVLLAEQLYRAWSMLAHHPYHRE